MTQKDSDCFKKNCIHFLDWVGFDVSERLAALTFDFTSICIFWIIVDNDKNGNILKLKVTNDGNTRFTTVPLKALSDQV